MKKLKLLTLLLLSSYILLAQTKEQYHYDAAGNRNSRNTCTGCRLIHNAPPATTADTLAQATDIKLAMNEGVSVFPNPTQNTITVNITGYNPEEITKVYVMDTNGKIVVTENINTVDTELNLGSLPPAVYYIKLQKGSKQLVYKIIKIQ